MDADDREAARPPRRLTRLLKTCDTRRDQPLPVVLLREELCAGRWSLIERFERAGRRYFLAHRNDPKLASQRALTERERQVLTSVARGHSNKAIAHSLGVAISTVATYLHRARRKLGDDGVDVLQVMLPIA
jgi:DNA-binding CsgD family transcriptional regulator